MRPTARDASVITQLVSQSVSRAADSGCGQELQTQFCGLFPQQHVQPQTHRHRSPWHATPPPPPRGWHPACERRLSDSSRGSHPAALWQPTASAHTRPFTRRRAVATSTMRRPAPHGTASGHKGRLPLLLQHCFFSSTGSPCAATIQLNNHSLTAAPSLCPRCGAWPRPAAPPGAPPVGTYFKDSRVSHMPRETKNTGVSNMPSETSRRTPGRCSSAASSTVHGHPRLRHHVLSEWSSKAGAATETEGITA